MPPVTDKLTILFLAANPSDTDQLKLDEELRGIDAELRKTEFRDRFDLRSHWAVRFGDLMELLLRYKPHIIHFSGHGSQAGEIILMDDAGTSLPVTPDALADLFSILTDNVRCVVLNACYSDQQARGIAKSIDCVVGMTRAIGDSAAIQFASGFYLGIGYGRNVKDAVGLGRVRISGAGLTEEKTPKLTVRKGVDPAQVVLIGSSTVPAAPTTTAGSSSALGSAPRLTRLSGQQFKQFQDALLAAFDDLSLNTMVKIALDQDLSRIANGNLTAKTFELINWAQRSGNLDRLLDGALAAEPGSPELQNLAATLRG